MAGEFRSNLFGSRRIEIGTLLVAPPDDLAAPLLEVVVALAEAVDLDQHRHLAQRRLLAITHRMPVAQQVVAQGRIVQIAFESTREIFSTEKFLIPYILEGEVRAYNQKMLERTQVRSQALFFCLEDTRNTWGYYEWINGRTGAFGRDQLVSLLERIV